MGIIKLLREGCWYVESKSDPRWNGTGEALVGMGAMPSAARAHIDRMKETLGEEPEDLLWGYHKY
jgi:hypothetical protein